MESRVEQAIQKHKEGYNCSQAVLCTYCDLLGVDQETAFRISEGFGAGMGGLRDTCGAVTALFMLIGLAESGGLAHEGKTKANTYKVVKNLAEEFKVKNGSIMCRELLNAEGANKKHTCPGCIADACKIAEEFLIKE